MAAAVFKCRDFAFLVTKEYERLAKERAGDGLVSQLPGKASHIPLILWKACRLGIVLWIELLNSRFFHDMSPFYCSLFGYGR